MQNEVFPELTLCWITERCSLLIFGHQPKSYLSHFNGEIFTSETCSWQPNSSQRREGVSCSPNHMPSRKISVCRFCVLEFSLQTLSKGENALAKGKSRPMTASKRSELIRRLGMLSKLLSASRSNLKRISSRLLSWLAFNLIPQRCACWTNSELNWKVSQIFAGKFLD